MKYAKLFIAARAAKSPRFSALLKLILFVACYSSLTTALAKAPPGGEQKWEAQYQQADWIARLRIESVASLINPSMSRDQLVAVQGYRYQASVVDHWKGNSTEKLRFQVDLGDCPSRLDVDKEYIVFGAVNYRGDLQSYACADIISLEQAQDLPSLLDRIKASPQLAEKGG